MELEFAILTIIILVPAFTLFFILGIGGFDWYDFFKWLFKRDKSKLEEKEPKIPEPLKPMVNAPNNRDFVIEMLKLRKETIEKDGFDPMCPMFATEEDRIAAAKLAATLEDLLNKYQDPEEFNKALSNINNKEN